MKTLLLYVVILASLFTAQSVRAVEDSEDYQTHEARAYYRLGQQHLQEGRLADALSEVEKALDLEPKNGELYLLLGRIQAAMGQHQRQESGLQ